MTTERQEKLIYALIGEKGIEQRTLQALLKQFGKNTVEELTTKEASQLIESLKTYQGLKERENEKLRYIKNHYVDCLKRAAEIVSEAGMGTIEVQARVILIAAVFDKLARPSFYLEGKK